jgi:hypothetical protein
MVYTARLRFEVASLLAYYAGKCTTWDPQTHKRALLFFIFSSSIYARFAVVILRSKNQQQPYDECTVQSTDIYQRRRPMNFLATTIVSHGTLVDPILLHQNVGVLNPPEKPFLLVNSNLEMN